MNPIAISIISYNRPDDALDCIKSILQLKKLETLLDEVVLLNNNSTVDYSKVEKFIKDSGNHSIKYIKHHENLGVARGRNYIFNQTSAPILIEIDDDAVFESIDTLEFVYNKFNITNNQTKELGVMCFKIKYAINNQIQESAFPHKKIREYINKKEFDTNYFIGAGHAILRKSLAEESYFYPDNFFYGMEEYDLSYRILNAGYTIRYFSQISILHKESPFGRVTNAVKLKMFWLNKCIIAYKYLPIIYFLSTSILWGFQYLIKSKFNLFGFSNGLLKIISIPIRVKRKPLSPETLNYLKSLKARLWY